MNTVNINENKENKYICTAIFSALVMLLTFSFVYQKMLTGGMNDIAVHVYTILYKFRQADWWRGWMAAPHCLWHLTVLLFFNLFQIPLEAAAAIATSIYSLLYHLSLVWLFDKVLGKNKLTNTSIKANLLALSFAYVQSFYLYWLDAGERYLGPFSINPLHNPTQMCLRAFSVIAFIIAIELVNYFTQNGYSGYFIAVENNPRKYMILLSVMLFLSTVMKPTFSEVFIPAVGIYMLVILIGRLVKKNGGEYFKKCLLMLLCATPALIYMLAQYFAFFFFEGSVEAGEGVIVTSAFEVWSLFTDNVFISVLLGMAFPIYMLVIDSRYFIKSTEGKLSLLAYVVGFLECAFLGEEGSRMSHANFIWPIMSGMLLVWLTSLLRLIALSGKSYESKKKTILLAIGWTLFALHVAFGIVFLYLEMMGL